MDLSKYYKNEKNYKHYLNCRFCFSKNITTVIKLGDVPLAGGFLKNKIDIKKEQLYPLDIAYCKNCFLLQSINVIEADTLFQNYFYHSSAIQTLENHFSTIADEIKIESQGMKKFVVEIGCNDGVLIKHLIKKEIDCLGIDPATNIVKPLIENDFPIINAYFTESKAKEISKKYGQADVICSFNVLAHIENMHDVIKGIQILLKEDGYLFFETHYLGNVLEELQYDMIYHEHQYYYSLLTLQKLFAQYDMEIYDVKPISIHAGSMRYYIQKKSGGRIKTKRVTTLENDEIKLKYNNISPYIKFQNKIEKNKNEILLLLGKLKKEKKTIAGYGASGRGTIIMNFCGIDQKYLDYVIDDSPAKQGAFTPGTHLKIVNSSILQTEIRPDYVLLFAWSFAQEIKKRNPNYTKIGGKYIVPLPKVTIL